MRYRSYRGRDGDEMPNSYGRRIRDSRGRYMEGSYGRRGVDAKYRGYGHLDDIADSYSDYTAYRESGSYSDKEDSMKSLEYMLKSVEDFMCMLEEDAKSEEEVNMIKKTAKRISDM